MVFMSISLNSETHLRQIQNAPYLAVEKQLLIPARATNVLLLKKLFGLFNHLDQLQLAEEDKKALQFLAEHDHIAYLWLTGNFELLNKIFGQKDEFYLQLARIKALEKEQEEILFWKISEQERVSLIDKQNKGLKQAEEQRKIDEERMLLHANMHEYFKLMERQIYLDYYLKQLELIDIFHKETQVLINRALDIAEQDESISVQDKRVLRSLRDQYDIDYQKIQASPIHEEDGSVNYEKVKSKVSDFYQLREKYFNDFMQLLQRNRQNRELGVIHELESNVNDNFAQESLKNKQNLDGRLKENGEHLKNSENSIKTEIERSMGEFLVYLQNTPSFNLLSDSCSKLKDCQEELGRTDDITQIKVLTKQFINELHQMKESHADVLQADAIKQIDFVAQLLSKLENPLQEPLLEVIPEPFAEPAAPQELIPIENEEEVGVDENERPAIEAERPGESAEERILRMKKELIDQKSREHAIPADLPNEIEVEEVLLQEDIAEEGNCLEFDSEIDKQVFKTNLSDGYFTVNMMIDNRDFNTEENPNALRLRELLEELIKANDEKILISKVTSIYNIMNKLSENHDGFETVMDTIEPHVSSGIAPRM